MHGHELIARTLSRLGVDTVFSLMGDGNLFVVDSFARVTDGQVISVAHEAAAVMAATGYARTTGRVGVATVTHGPGLTNALTPLVEAVRSHSPIVLVAADTAVAAYNVQSIDQREVVLVSGAGFEQLRTAETAAADLARAFRRAVLERRPVVVNMPVELQWSEVEEVPVDSPASAPHAVRPSVEDLDDALGLIVSSRRPVVLAGKGAVSAQARAAVLALARRIGAPVCTTLQAHGLFRGEPEALGVCGTLGTDTATTFVSEADLVIAMGASLNPFTTAQGDLLAGSRVLQVDLRPDALGEHVRVHCAVVGDTAATATLIVDLLDAAEAGSSGYRDQAITALAAQGPAAPTGTMDIHAVLAALDAQFPAERAVVLDAGRFFFSASTGIPAARPDLFVLTMSFGSIGLGMGHALGVAAGSPATPVLLVCGDGGFMMGGLAEFNTAVRYGLDITVVVLNDGSYGAEHVQFTARGMDPGLSLFDWPDFAEVAVALGGSGHVVRTLGQLEDALRRPAVITGPRLLDVHLDPSGIPTSFH